jgi:MarR family transcriptional regulator, organic hydroperoxide resistance regulator
MTRGIRGEIKQAKPFASLEEEAAVSLARTADRFDRAFSELFKKQGLTGTQYNVLRILRGAGSAGLACSEIGERMVTRDPDITRLLDRMERAGLCIRSRDSSDRRVILTRITEKGLGLLRDLDKPVQALNKKLLGHMEREQLKSLLSLLDTVRSGP